jgi:hypothetical protein
MAKRRKDGTWAVIEVTENDRKDLAERAHQAGFRVVRKGSDEYAVNKKLTPSDIEIALKGNILNTGYTGQEKAAKPKVSGPGLIQSAASATDRSPALEAAGAAADAHADIFLPIQDEARAGLANSLLSMPGDEPRTPADERAYGKKLQDQHPVASRIGSGFGLATSVAAPARHVAKQAFVHGAAGSEGGLGERAIGGAKSAILAKGAAGILGGPGRTANRAQESGETFSRAVGQGQRLMSEASEARAAADAIRQRAAKQKASLPGRERAMEDAHRAQMESDLERLMTPEQRELYGRYVEEVVEDAGKKEAAAIRSMQNPGEVGTDFLTVRKGPRGALLLDPIEEKLRKEGSKLTRNVDQAQKLGKKAADVDPYGGPRAVEAKAIREGAAKRMDDERAAMRAASKADYDSALRKADDLVKGADLSEEGANRIRVALKDSIAPDGSLKKVDFTRRMAELDNANREKFLGALADDLFDGAPGFSAGKAGKSAASVARGALMAAGKDKLAWQMFAFGASAGDAAYLLKMMRNRPAARQKMIQVIESGELDKVTTNALTRLLAKTEDAARSLGSGAARVESTEQSSQALRGVRKRREEAEKR